MKPKKLALALAASALTCTSQAAIVAYWDLDTVNEAESSTAGTLSGDAAIGGTAIAPGGSGALTTTTGMLNANMVANDITGFGGTGSFTVLAWVQTTGTSDQTIFSYTPSNGVTGGADLRLFVQSNGDLRVEMSAGAGFNLSSGAFDLGDGATHMVGVLFDSSTGDSFQDVDLYVDGTIYNVTGGTDHTVNIAQTVSGGGNGIRFGQDNAGGRQFSGTIDDVGIFDTALTSGELANYATNGIPEPSTALLGGLGVLGLLRRRRM